MQVYKANYQAHRIYVPQQVLTSKINLFRASEKNLLEGAVEDEEGFEMLKPDLGWNKFSITTSIHVVPGNHMTMMQEPYVQVLAAQLRASLEHSASLP
ncbi:amino acid adenylation [Calothrix sp. NIES-4071]|nr:amino acid adenylation [Calothrix sp. NIES-4071]BAZ55727.1 amino acid adenylation [Calothrix sp. NIES-4105]